VTIDTTAHEGRLQLTESVVTVPVLLVDDIPDNRVALAAVLDSGAYELVNVHSGEDAFREVRRRDFAVVLLDVQMPGMDGFDTAMRMKQVAGRSVPIIFVTDMDAAPSQVLRAYAQGAVDVIQRPPQPEAIRAKVAVFAELYRARQHLARSLRTLTDLALALSKTRTPEEVAAAIVDEGMCVAQADTCSLYVLDERGSALDLIGHRGIAPEILERTRRMTEASRPSAFEAIRSGATTWIETADDYARLHPELATLRTHGKRARAFWSVPLVVEGRGIGLLGMGFYTERRFPPEERALVDTLTKQCAQALLRSVRLEREERGQAWLVTTLRSIGDAVIATDPAGCVVLMNGIAEQLTGWPEAEARGRPLEEVFAIVSDETRVPCENPVTRVLREGKVVGLANHTVLRSRRGIDIPIDDSAAPIRDAKGALFGVVLVFRDVTTEKREQVRREFLARAGAALASSLDYRAILAAVAQFAVPQLADWCGVDLLEPGTHAPQQVAVAHVDPQKVRWARELGEKYPPDPNAATGAPQVIRSGNPELYSEIPASLLEAGARDEAHLRIIRELRLESAMVVPLKGRERTLGAMTFIYADSGRRYTEEDLAFGEEFARRAAMAIENALALKQTEDARKTERLLREESDVANRMKDEFLATVSHELRTPLNAILGWTMTLRARNLADDLDRALAIIERNARRQVRLVEDVLDVSRIISGKLSLNVAPTNIAEGVEGAIESVTPAADAKGIHIHSNVDASFTIMADADRLQQVVWNLLANAVKFTPKGGEVAVRAYREGSYVCICVADTGEGIASEALGYIFDPFRQADASTTRRHGGLGLGLAIVKQLVAAHGGTIHASSKGPGQGSKFVVTLPAHGAVPSVSANPWTAVPTMERNTMRPATIRLDGLSVLVVDDEEDARGIIGQVLQDHGATVTTATSAFEALGELAATKTDVIVSDIGMPEMDGYAFIRTVRALPVARGARTPAVALTAYARKEDAQRAFAAGFQMHVPKPIEPAQLVTIVANLAGLSLGGS
jgi:PAS domain S-box-containing protein